MAKIAANRYAESLFEIAKEQDQMEELSEQVTAVLDILRQNPELLTLLTHPKITKDEKKAVVENVFRGKADDVITGLFVVVIEKGRCAELPEILDEFLKKSMEFRGIGRANVVSAAVLPDAQKKKIEEKLLVKTGYRKLLMNYSVDPALIGGMTIQIGDRVVDASVRSKLGRMAGKLQKLQLENNLV